MVSVDQVELNIGGVAAQPLRVILSYAHRVVGNQNRIRIAGRRM